MSKNIDDTSVDMAHAGLRISHGSTVVARVAAPVRPDRLVSTSIRTVSLACGVNERQRLIREPLARPTRGRTSLVIAQRLGAVLAADSILVLDRGRETEHRTHVELFGREGVHASLYRTQFKEATRPLRRSCSDGPPA